jgi:hypothetical protein
MCAGRHGVMSCYVVRRGGVETGQAFLKELREFLRFLRSLWGILAGISVLFPLSNVVVTVIPIGDGGKPFQNLSPNVVTAITMVTCIFLIFATFSRRSEFTQRRRRTRYALSARVSFLVALGTLAAYVLASHGLYRTLITDNPDLEVGIAVYDGLFATLYIATFALLSRAFLVLAMLEYFPQKKAALGGSAGSDARW